MDDTEQDPPDNLEAVPLSSETNSTLLPLREILAATHIAHRLLPAAAGPKAQIRHPADTWGACR